MRHLLRQPWQHLTASTVDPAYFASPVSLAFASGIGQYIMVVFWIIVYFDDRLFLAEFQALFNSIQFISVQCNWIIFIILELHINAKKGNTCKFHNIRPYTHKNANQPPLDRQSSFNANIFTLQYAILYTIYNTVYKDITRLWIAMIERKL